MKRVGFLWERVVDADNIERAILNASRGKCSQHRVKIILEDVPGRARELQGVLENGYVPSEYVTKTISDGTSGKIREIMKPKFWPDQVIHWALMQIIQPIIMRGMYEYSCGSVPGRGTTHGQRALRRWLDKDPRRTKYCLKLDIRQFYPSVNHGILKSQFRRVIKDARVLELIDLIIDSSPGLPIGNYTSQWFSNFYLQGLDHFIKQELGVPYYIRYVDDLVLLGPNKRRLHVARVRIAEFLQGLDLVMKGDWQVFPVRCRAIDFLGMRFYRSHTTLRGSNALRIRRRMKRIWRKEFLTPRDAAAVVSYWGWVKRTNSYRFYHKYIKPYVSIREARRVISDAARVR